jgi:hypothetical protein
VYIGPMTRSSLPDLSLGGLLPAVAGLLIVSAYGPAARADSLRCGNRLIVVEMAMAEVRRLCGEPESIEVEERPIFARGPKGSIRTGSYRIERWLYPRRGGQFPAQLTFESGRLTRIELLTRSRS